ncbi:glycoside hydrolase family 3 C-terminal domain-containing protein [Actinomadura madurae]|uniref:glycoside hydrolase family 3 protein n=1 Tax=Actinomadura madurae TaxID=1993 RepID=UPI0020D20FDE|nr:glycoside hydrolase family 3 C-terminal domain-containing protein [Actinomadura madurae]MCP9971098.1 glycoside hydrolase family 3 C-terminal domain-containing protein [Actinomadura madurae]
MGEATTAVALSLDGGDPAEGMLRPPEHRVGADLPAGVPVPVELRHSCAPSRFGASFGLGYHEPHPSEDEELAAAVAAARDADAAVVVVGTNDEVESEGFDRTSLALPGRQDELVSAVAAANARTIVVVNAGAPVLMPWRDEVAAVLWAWLPGQEGGDAIADVLTGAAEPGGRLPTTLPASGDGVLSPIPSEDGTLDYAEGTAIGYRHYTPAQVAYPFGHGLGYTTWAYESLAFSGDVAEVTVRNTGSRAAGRSSSSTRCTARRCGSRASPSPRPRPAPRSRSRSRRTSGCPPRAPSGRAVRRRTSKPAQLGQTWDNAGRRRSDLATFDPAVKGVPRCRSPSSAIEAGSRSRRSSSTSGRDCCRRARR